MAAAPAGVHGESMREFLQNRPADLKQTQFETNSIETPEYSIPGTSEETPA